MELSLIGFACLFALCFLGLPLGFALILVGTVGFAYLRGLAPAMAMASQQIVDLATNESLSVLPLFVLMGAFIHQARLSEELYDATHAWLGHRRGGLAMATIVACGGFAAVSGSSLATAATMAKVAMPPMRRFGYGNGLATGSIAAGGTLGILIPPSVPMVIYGILTDTDIGRLFIAGIVPGLLLIGLFVAAIAVTARFNPDAAPAGPLVPWKDRWRALLRVWGVVALFALVLGGIYAGIFTATEAAGIGAVGALAFALSRRQLGWRAWVDSLMEAGTTAGMIFIVAFGALIFSNFVSLAGLTGAMVAAIEALSVSPAGVVIAMCVIFLILGCVFDSLAMLLLTIPIFAAILEPLGVDLIWFGILSIVAIEIGLITPPIGMNVFIVKTVVPDVATSTIFRGVLPFILAAFVGLVLIFLMPQIALWLPNLMR